MAESVSRSPRSFHCEARRRGMRRADYRLKHAQSFGDSSQPHNDVDTITAVKFDRTGTFMATGDKGGRIVLFHNSDTPQDEDNIYSNEKTKIETAWSPYCQFLSHELEFDYLKSLDIEAKINDIKFVPYSNSCSNCTFLLSTNDKSMKFWKINDSNQNSYIPTARESYISGGGLTLPRRSKNPVGAANLSPSTQLCSTPYGEKSITASCKRLYHHVHAYHINSISLNSDGESFLSADDLRINLWNFEQSDKCFNLLDMKPSNMDELNEVITVARFHKSDCNKLLYSTSKGVIRLADTRASVLCDKQAKFYGDRDCDMGKSFFSEIVASISDTDFDPTGRYIISRDYLSIKVWDINMDSEPVYKYEINDNLKSILCDLYETDSIFDKFDLCVSNSGGTIVTGGYNSQLYVSNLDGSKLCKTSLRTELPTSAINSDNKIKNNGAQSVDTATPIDINRKILHCAYHPHEDTIAVTENACLYLYKVAPEL